MAYLGKVWRNAVRRYKARLAAGRERLMGWIIQTAIVFGILYFQPWIGNLEDEAKLAAAGVAAILFSALISFIWDLLVSPKDLHDQLGMERDVYAHALGYKADAAQRVTAALDLYREGERIYQDEVRYASWRDGLIEWDQRVRRHLADYYDPLALFHYEQAEGRGVMSKYKEIIDEDQPRRGEYNEVFTYRLKAFENVIHMYGPSLNTHFPTLLSLNQNDLTPERIRELHEENRRKCGKEPA